MRKEAIKRFLNFLIGGRDSVFFLMEGFNQSGKTDFMLWLMQQFHYFKMFRGFGCNQVLEDTPFEYDFISDLETLMKKVTTFNKRYFFFLDELGKSVARATPWDKLNIELIKEFETKRKFKLSIGACAIGQVDRRIKNPAHLDFYIRKLSLKTAKVYHLLKRKQLFISGISRTSIKFHEFKVAVFTKESVKGTPINDSDIRNAEIWAKQLPHPDVLSKQGFYDSVRRGYLKLLKLVDSSGQAY